MNPAVLLAGVFAALLVLSAAMLYPDRQRLQGRRAYRRDVACWFCACILGIPAAWVLAMLFSGAAAGFLRAVGVA